MEEAFTRKKVESLTLGEKLKKLRSQYRMSLTEISRATKIQVKYLEYLENGEYSKLPAEVYTKGFLKMYARHLGLDETVFLKLYEKEKNIQAHLGEPLELHHRPRLPLTSSFVLTSRTVLTALTVLLVLGTFLYLFREFRSFIVEPVLFVYEPTNGSSTSESRITVKGKSDRGSEVFVNDQEIFVDDEGGFSEDVVLRPGINTITVRARNRFEKERVEVITLEAQLASSPLIENNEAREKFTLSLRGQNGGAAVVVEADGEIVYSGELGGGDEQTVTAVREIKLSVSQGENIQFRFRGGDPQVLSTEGSGPVEARFSSKGREQ